ncbi:ABC-ATPase domain-containing protein [Halalkalibacter kiskunsagensis]|uniref:ABC-ATPase domain-containing protein n=1 Tax=Halalkalibacter kiskunsagensis TaxID=1548599 RepID=A0ABV6KFQ4_9BACI
MNKLKELLRRIDKKGYKTYKDIQGNYSFAAFTCSVLWATCEAIESISLVKSSRSRLVTMSSRSSLVAIRSRSCL